MVAEEIKDRNNPFPGLRPFLQEESRFFFGRENETREIIRKLYENRFIAVIGSSGSGKSSLVNSGVIPGLLNYKNAEAWKVISLRPGSNPLKNLSDAFARSILNNNNDFGESDDMEISHLRDNPNWISSLKNIIAGSGEKVLIVVDQFEELFTRNSEDNHYNKPEDAVRFAGLLENAVKQESFEVYVIILVRTDFIGECAGFHGLIKMMNNSNFLMPRMTLENCKAVIENPLKAVGAEIDPKFVDTILNDLGDQPDQLPVLQHLMMRSFDYWKEHGAGSRPIEITDYIAVGTITGAMSRHADEAFNELSDEGKDICKRFFKAITGKGSDNRDIRHPMTFGALKSVVQCNEKDLLNVIEKFRAVKRSFIVPRYDTPINDDTFIDISHESIMHLWGRLKEWIDDEAASVRIYRRLSEASAMYQQGKTTLLKNPDLQIAINWREKQKPTVEWAERYDPAFERAIVYLRTSEKALIDEEERKSILQKKKIRTGRIIASILGIFAVIFLGLMLVTFTQKNAINKQRAEALKQKAAAVEYATASERVAIASRIQLASADSVADAAKKNEAEALQQKAIFENRSLVAERRIINAETAVKNAIDEKNLVAGKRMVSLGKSLALKSLLMTEQKDLQALLAYQGYLFNKRNGGNSNDADIYQGLYNITKTYGNQNYRNFSGHTDAITSIAFVPGQREFYTSGEDGKIIKWGLDNRNQTLQVIYSGSEIINVLAISSDQNWLASGSQNAGIKMIPLKGNGIGYELKGHTGPIKSLIFSYDGRYLYSASLDGRVLKWDLSVRTSTDISQGLGEITSIDLSSDNRYIAGINNEGKVIVWDPVKNTDNFRIEAEGKRIKTVRFKPDDDILGIGYTDGFFELWDISSKAKLSGIKAHTDEVNDIRFNSKFSQIATASNDGLIKLWNSEDFTVLPISLEDNEGLVISIEFSPDGQVIVSGSTGKSNNLKGRATNNELLAQDVCSAITRNFTTDEWISYVGRDIPYEATCTENQYNIKVKEIK